MPSPRWCDGATAEAAAAAARDRFGAGVQVSVAPVRTGGVGGFFTKELYRATVVEPDPASQPETGAHTAPVDAPAQLPDRVAEALALLTAAPGATVPTTVPATAVTPDEPEATRAAADGVLPVTASAPPEAPTVQSAFLSALAQVQMTPTVTQAVARATGTRPTVPPALRTEPSAPADPPRTLEVERVDEEPAPVPQPAGVAETPAPTPQPVRPVRPVAPVAVLQSAPADQWARTVADLGIPADLVTPELLDRIRAHGAHAAFTHLFRQRIPAAPSLETAPGKVIVVVGIGADALSGARHLAEAAGLDPDQTLMTPSATGAPCGPPELVVTGTDQVLALAATARESATPTVVAVDVPLPRERGTVPAAVRAIADWAPTSVWAAVDTTRHGRDLAAWAAVLPTLTGVVALHVEFAAAPASALACRAPVALLEARRATPARWASVLCERLAEEQA